MKTVITYTNRAGRTQEITKAQLEEMFPAKAEAIKKAIQQMRKELRNVQGIAAQSCTFGSVTVHVATK